ncbi:fused MFS/spermidine synthase [Paenibacillus aurantius]|uniref:Fused MFS/spermidine synthase n=1 Tax=Paenibacillus aurantius TaxID=2918900 RepID=A0AA96LED5_9BACL|nr:fused MFS/spermidine synthase [Paenibacillus aurantius]WNQ12171.1 fused MFS/spermidine synthase [Paenibacillus aurantius]
MQPLHQEVHHTSQISVYDTDELYGEKGRFRVLQFSEDAIQGALDLDHPERIVFEYPRAMIHLIEANHPSLERLFVIGHGIGTISGYFERGQVTTAELEPGVVELSRRFFGYAGGPLMVGDGREILEREAPGSYDAIVLDAFQAEGTPLHLLSREFIRMARGKLEPTGSLLMNLTGKRNDKLVSAVHTTLQGEFPYTQTFSLPAAGSAEVRNFVIMGSGKPITYQTRQMAGFTETELGQGYVIKDGTP